MAVALHTAFLGEMKEMLGTEYDDYLTCMAQPHERGIRVNTLKFPVAERERLGLALEPCPFAPDGFYLRSSEGSVGRSPWHHAGAFYSQEPSAMSAVTVLNPQPGDRVLDVCAAPGGKSTQMAAALQGEGLLWSNEYVKKRAQILLSNLERMGVRNAVVSNTHPDILAAKLSGFFDKVLVDAPCSGEGMFRRDPAAVSEWSPEHSKACAVRQLAILESAAECVREGGVLVYSTCTFSFCENENVAAAFLERHPEFVMEDSGVTFGRPGFNRSDAFDLTLARRIFPMDGGEGHFVARLRKTGGNSSGFFTDSMKISKPNDTEKRAAALFEECFTCAPYGEIVRIGESCYLQPMTLHNIPDLRGLGILRGGVLLGDVLRGRIEPSHALFMAMKPEECRRAVSFAPDSAALSAFLHGEETELPASSAGWKGFTAVACGNTVTGFGKASGGRLKNRYPKGLRTLH